jgi:FkbM family methyltransferase
MRVTTMLRNVSLATGLYRLARRVHASLLDRGRLAYFPKEVALYHQLIPPGALCFDVGANIGERTEALLAAGCRVVAFEPLREMVRELEAHCTPYPQVQLVLAALGAVPSFAPIFKRAMHGQSGLVEQWEGETVETIAVPVLTLDLAMAHFGVPYYCKIDVEGYELEVLRGCSQTIPLVSLEFHVTPTDQEKTLACLAYLAQMGLRSVNMSQGESPLLVWESWRALEGFQTWFPALMPTLRPGSYGDLWVRVEPVHGGGII